MASKNELIKSKVQGIFYREHPNRKHGVTKDRQWIIVQKIAGTRRVSTIGWGSAGCTFGDVVNKAAEYKARFRQALCRARYRLIRYLSGTVIHLIAMGQVNNFF